MSKKKQSSSPPPPAPPKPQNEYFYENDALKSQRVYDPKLKGYVSKSFSTPAEQNVENKANSYISGLMDRFSGDMNLTPEKIASYGEAYANPQIAALNESYNKSKGLADMAAGSSGMRNSVGFQKYGANEIERNRAQGLADIAANRHLMELDLPNKILSPYVNQFNLVNAALSGEQASMAQDFSPAMQGSIAGQNAAQQNYQNQLQYWQAQQKPQQKSGGNFLGWLIGANSLY